jgi:hypothetical protein
MSNPSIFELIIKKLKGSRVLGRYTDVVPKSISFQMYKACLVKAFTFKGGLRSPATIMRGNSSHKMTLRLIRKKIMTVKASIEIS